MKQISILSGKGGTGKTFLAASLAAIAQTQAPILADCDADAPNLHLLLGAKLLSEEEFLGMPVAISKSNCTLCLSCVDVCAFQAISPSPEKQSAVVVPWKCRGCEMCLYACPNEAIEMKNVLAGTIREFASEHGTLFNARLKPAQAGTGKAVSLIRKKAEDRALDTNTSFVLIDGPPGIGCPAVSTLIGTDACVLVAEPTVSGFNDLKRAILLLKQMNVPGFVVINKCDINENKATEIAGMTRDLNVPLLGAIPYSSQIQENIRNSKMAFNNPAPIREVVVSIWQSLLDSMRS